MQYTDRKVTAVVTWMTAFVAGLIGLGLPLVYFALTFSYNDSALQTEAEINARIVDQLINANPDMWQFEQERLTDPLHRRPGTGTQEVRLVRTLDGQVVAESGADLPTPLYTRAADLRDSGRKVGTIEISRSLRPILVKTGLIALVGFFLGYGIIMLRIVPLRMLRRFMAALFEEKERAQVTLRSIGDGVITTDDRGNVLLLNGVAEQLTGWTQEEAKGKRLNEIFRIVNERTRAERENPVDRVLRGQRAADLADEAVLIGKDGSERVITDNGAPIQGEEGGITGVVLVFRDVTDRRKHREEMQRADKLESVGLLAGGIAHDFNNILASIMGNISLAQLCAACDEEMNDFLTKADNACVRARDLTRQLLTFAKGGAPVKELLSLGDLVRASTDFALTGSNVRAEIHISDDLPPVSVDGGQINQVINNLVINAVEAMPEGGVITIGVERVLIGADGSPPLPSGPYAVVSVRDRGTGIAKEVLPRIFDPYFSTKKRGSGLGLATCYSVVRRHGGHITVTSGPREGSCFQVYLPASSGSSALQSRTPADGIIRGTGKILVMDDDESVRETACRMLVGLGYEAELAADGDDAVVLFQQALDSSRPFDAVILDLTIPGGMGGRETMRNLLELSPGIRAVVSSGYSDNPIMGDFARYGFCAVLSKPYDVREMSRVLYSALGNDSTPSGPEPVQ